MTDTNPAPNGTESRMIDARRSRLSWVRRLSWTGWLAVAVLSVYIAASVLAPVIAPYAPDEIFVGGPFDPPSADFLLGTDGLGRDIFSRLLFGGSKVLWTAAGASAISVLFCGVLGLWLGYRRGRTDEIVMRCLEIIMSIPSIILSLLILGLFGASPLLVMVIVGVLQIPSATRIIRAATLTVVEEDFIAAARARGETELSIALRELLPNVLSVLVVEFSIRCGFSALFIASLGFLGFGAAPPDPDWGLMINEGRNSLDQSVWMVVAPATGIALLVISINLLTDSLLRAMGRNGDGQ